MNGAVEDDPLSSALGGPTGLGTAGTRIIPSTSTLGLNRFRNFSYRPFQQVGPTQLPEFYLPYPLRLSPHLDSARQHCLDWSGAMGFYDPILEAGGTPIWTEAMNRGFDFAVCSAGIDPDASVDELALSADWLAWGTYADDYYPIVFGRRRDLLGARILNERLCALMPIDSAATIVPANPIERGLADIWRRTAASMSTSAQHQLRQAIEDMLESWCWELVNQLQHRIPDPVDYVEMRRKTFGSDLTMSLCRLRRGHPVPTRDLPNPGDSWIGRLSR